MPQDIVSGLFGLSPMQVQQQQDAAIESAANQYAQQDPFARASAALYRGGAGLGRIGAGMLGMVNPQVQQAQQTQQVMMQGDADLSTSDGLLAKANQFRQIDPRIAMQLTLKANEMKKQEAAAKLQEAHAAYYAREKQDPKEVMMLEIATDLDESPEKRKMAADWLAKNGSSGKGGTGRMVTQQTTEGNFSHDPYTNKTYYQGTTDEVPPDVVQRARPFAFDVPTSSAIALAKAGGKAVGAVAGEAIMELPKIENDIATIKDLGTQLFSHPGFKNFVGAGFPGLKYLQGSAVPGAEALVNQINGIAGLMARKEMSGQGQITEKEADAALAAFSRLNGKLSESDFRAAYAEFVKRVENVREILRKKAGMTFDQSPFQAPQIAQQTNMQTTQTSAQKPFNETITSAAQAYDLYKKGVLTKESANKIIHEIKKFGVR